ncbi:tyrosine-protein kinase Etk/Wzc [Mucilaginibacter sp. UYNi724]
MNTRKPSVKAVTIREKNTPITDLKKTVTKYLYHWPLFAIGLVLTLTIAFIYIKLSRPIYEIRATLLIKDEKKTPDPKPALQEIDVLSSSKITENEIQVIKSKEIISKVIQDLQLWVTYQKKDGLRYKDLYDVKPFILVVIKSNGNYDDEKLKVVVNNSTSFLLTENGGEVRKILFKDVFQTNLGTIKFQPTRNVEQYEGATIKLSFKNPEDVALDYQEAIGANQMNKLATTVDLTLNDAIPQRGKDVLNRLIYNYKLAGDEEKNRETKNALDFIDQRLASITGDLTNAEKGIEEFKSSRGLTDISSQSQISLENMQVNDTRLNDVNVQLSVIDGIERYVNSSQSFTKAPATLGITDAALSSLIAKLSELQLQRERLLGTTPETNPDFEPINRQIASTKDAIKENVKSIKSSLLSTRNKLQSFNSGFESSIKNVPTQERQYVSIKRQQAIKESLYTYLLQKREEISVSYASSLNNDRIVDQAYSGQGKVPQRPLALMAALILGVALPAGMLFRRYNSKITDVDEIRDSLTAPVIGELPFDSSASPIAISTAGPTPLSEQFRSLRTKLFNLSQPDEKAKVYLVTSSLPGEGKSFVSCNLSATMAFSGKKTVLLEMDMRKPKLAKTLGLSQTHAGISDFLNNKSALKDIVQKCGVEGNLDFISSGEPIQNPSELLEGSRLEDLINDLRNAYDNIVIDSPPVRLVSDGMILSRLSDINLYIIRQGVTEKAEIGFIQQLIDEELVPEIQIIFNGIQRIKYGYGYNFSNTDYYNISSKQQGAGSIFGNFSERL